MNARKSTGPTTEAGKKRSALNAIRHGLTGQVVILPEEEMEAFNRFVAPLVTSLKMPDAPDDAHEDQLAQMYAKELWRINRCAAMEDAMLTLGVMEDVAENLNIENPKPTTPPPTPRPSATNRRPSTGSASTTSASSREPRRSWRS